MNKDRLLELAGVTHEKTVLTEQNRVAVEELINEAKRAVDFAPIVESNNALHIEELLRRTSNDDPIINLTVERLLKNK